MNKIRKDDEVVVTIGKDRGRRGKVTAVHADSVIVEGINIAKKHQKPNPQLGVTGGVIEKEMPIAISNVAIWNPRKGKDGAADRVGFKFVGEGEKRRKVRVFKSNGESLEG